jgi:hypothetical protein
VFDAAVPGLGNIIFCHDSHIEHLMLIMSCQYFRSQRLELTMNQLMFTILTLHGTVLGEK